MSRAFVIVGADTNVGKTVFAAALADALGAHYWKPVQAGLTPETDSRGRRYCPRPIACAGPPRRISPRVRKA